MKKFILLFTLVALIGPLQSQETLNYFVNGSPLETIDLEYIQIVGTTKILSNKLNIELDFGQHNNIWKTSDSELKDSNGKKVVFNSMIDALNFMVKNGYEYVNSYVMAKGDQNVYHYLLRRVKRE